MFNIICLCWLLISLAFSFFLEKSKIKTTVLRIMSVIVFIYKSFWFIVNNVKGTFVVPVEISTITYFITCVVFMFRIKYLYSVASFFGILAGIGFFSFYILFGFRLEDSFTVKETLIGCFSHGFVLVAGIDLFMSYRFESCEKNKLWITILAMLSWALVFYDMNIRGITFIYYIIKPEFLLLSSNMSINAIIIFVYYIALVTIFYFIVKLFFKLNGRDFAHKKSLPA